MRKLVVAILVSLDGYVAGPDGDFMVMPIDESFSAYNLERLRSADTLLLGRSTFEMFRAYRPSVAEDPTPRRRRAGDLAAQHGRCSTSCDSFRGLCPG